MAFNITPISGEACDKCSKLIEAGQGCQIKYTSRQYPSAVIFVHYTCLDKGVVNSKRKSSVGA